MLKSIKLQQRILIVHGVLALCLGLALFYLRTSMTNQIFEAVDIVIAVTLAAAALVLGGIADWFAAWNEGIKHLHRLAFYLLAGLALALAGVFLGIYSQVSMQRLVIFAAIHAVAFGVLALTLSSRANRHALERRGFYLFGALSIVFSGTMTGLARQLDDPAATTTLGVYFCFVGTTLLFLAWISHRVARIAEKVNVQHHHGSLPIDHPAM